MNIYDGRIINNFLEPNKRQYTIPVYQRDYAWSKEQCTKLFEDVVRVGKSDNPHFCGSIVYAPLKSDGKIDRFVIIDGQQRLTTVYILLKALADMAESDKQRNAMEEDLMNSDKFDEYGIDAASKLKLKPIKSDNEQLLFLMAGKHDKIDKSCGVWKNYQVFCELIKEQLNGGLSVMDIYRGVEKLRVARIELDREDDAQETFERINSTGMPLTLADLIRNYVLMTDSDQEKLYEDYWHPAETAIKQEHLNDFFMDYLNFKADSFPREDEAYGIFKNIFKQHKYTNETMLKELLHYAEFYKTFLYGSNKCSAKTNELLRDFRELKQTTVFLFLFHVFDDYSNNIISQNELEKILQFLLNYSIRRIVCEVGSNSLRGLYKTLHARVFVREENKQHYYDSIVSFFMHLSSKDALQSDEAFTEALERNNLYRKNALCKYLLTVIENQGKEQLLTDNLTIEHIMPQNRNLSTSWQVMLGDNWREIKDRYLHTLGNLTLTGYNSELGDKPFAEKKEKLSDVHTKVITLYEDVKSCDSWNENAIITRAKRLSGIILRLFPITPPTEIISFSDSRYNEYTCDDPSSATYKYINYYILQGEQVNCTTFADMMKSVCYQLYARDKTIIETMARNNETLYTGATIPMFSYDSTKVRGDYKIKDTDIFESTGFSASDIIWRIRALLDKYDIEHSDFVYSARISKQTADKEDNNDNS